MRSAQHLDGRHRGRIARHHDGFCAALEQEPGHGQGPLGNHRFRLRAIGRIAGIGKINQVFMGKLRPDMAQHRQAAHAGVKNADGSIGANGRRGRHDQAEMTGTFSASMRAAHSFGPVLCTEVPLASTATVTGMSVTSNS